MTRGVLPPGGAPPPGGLFLEPGKGARSELRCCGDGLAAMGASVAPDALQKRFDWRWARVVATVNKTNIRGGLAINSGEQRFLTPSRCGRSCRSPSCSRHGWRGRLRSPRSTSGQDRHAARCRQWPSYCRLISYLDAEAIGNKQFGCIPSVGCFNLASTGLVHGAEMARPGANVHGLEDTCGATLRR